MTAPPPNAPSHASESLQTLATQYRLFLEAGLSTTRQQLIFRILNRTIALLPYDRAVLWDLTSRRPRLFGVSGTSEHHPYAPLVSLWRKLIVNLEHKDRVGILEPTSSSTPSPSSLPSDSPHLSSVRRTVSQGTSETSFEIADPSAGHASDRQAAPEESFDLLPVLPKLWTRLIEKMGPVSIVWVPIRVENRVVAGLWLERWREQAWSSRELRLLRSLAVGYGIAWRVFAKTNRWGSFFLSRLLILLFVVALGLALTEVRLPLRIVAPCEIIPDEPIAVTAPLLGVIDRLQVRSGQEVKKGDPIAFYEEEAARKELEVAQQEVAIVQEELQRRRVEAFRDPRARGELLLLEKRLQQEMARLELARYRVERLVIRAPCDGVVMMNDLPDVWKGRPVSIGERILTLIDPTQTRLQIWLPRDDYIRFDPARPVDVVLHADPRGKRQARLADIRRHAETTPEGLHAFRAEAIWNEEARDLTIGLQGTAILYGEEVPLGYWILRRPYAWLRRTWGF